MHYHLFKGLTTREEIYFISSTLLADEFKSYLEELTKDKANGEHETPMLTKEQAQFKFLLL